jgi:flagellar basal body-associated protein FliL
MTTPDDPTAESHPPKKDGSFLLVVILAGVVLIIAFIAAFLFIKGGGKHVVPGKHDAAPTSQLVLPAANSSSMMAQDVMNLHSSLSNKRFKPVSNLLRA